MPDVEQVLDKVMKANYTSVFDARSGYWQLGCRQDCQWLTAFVTHSGVYEWTRTPFGMKNSGATFVRAIQEILKPIQAFSTSYVDDMAVMSDEWHGHLNHIAQFLEVVKRAGLTLSLKKCEFGKHQVTYVGHLAGSGTKKPDP
jgi:hypothetical protein